MASKQTGFHPSGVTQMPEEPKDVEKLTEPTPPLSGYPGEVTGGTPPLSEAGAEVEKAAQEAGGELMSYENLPKTGPPSTETGGEQPALVANEATAQTEAVEAESEEEEEEEDEAKPTT